MYRDVNADIYRVFSQTRFKILLLQISFDRKVLKKRTLCSVDTKDFAKH